MCARESTSGFLFVEQFKLRVWLDYTKGLVGGAERGPQFEWFAHVVLGRLNKNLVIKLTELPTSGRVGKTEEKELFPFASETILYKELSDITSLKVGQYVQPLKGTEAAIDAFCLSNGIPWEEKSTDDPVDPVLLLFQMTVAVKHPMLGEPIKKIINHVHKVGGNEFDPNKHKIYLVFIVEDLLPKAETYLTKSRTGGRKALLPRNLGHLAKIKQVCFQIE
jgi:hypothetical protein